MKNILIPTDFSDNAWNAVRYAISFFEQEECNFCLLHVSAYEVAALGSSIQSIGSSFKENQSVVEQFHHLQKKIDQLPLNTNHRFFLFQEYVYLVDSIRKVIKEKSIDYVVMGTKGASGLKEKIIGSNTGDVITKVKCPILVVPEKAEYKRIKEVVFPTDYNIHYKSKVVSTITEILDLTKSNINVLHITKLEKKLTDLQLRNKNFLKDSLGEHKPSFHFSYNLDLEEGVQYFVENRRIDMIAMIAKNLNFFQRILFHPTIEKISYHTTVPFLVLHE